jgi:protein-S-isoprenylcysteine O-methyltransferase Ste14
MNFDVQFWVNLCWAATALVWLVTSLRLKAVQRVLSPGLRALQIGLQIFGAVLMFSTVSLGSALQTQVLPHALLPQATGLALAATGNAIAIAARAYLGSNWSGVAVIRQNHELICSGPYALVRHPIYTGLVLAVCGTAIAAGEVRQLIAVPIFLVAIRIKQATEETLLTQAFGDRYRAYRHAVKWAIVPFVI